MSTYVQLHVSRNIPGSEPISHRDIPCPDYGIGTRRETGPTSTKWCTPDAYCTCTCIPYTVIFYGMPKYNYMGYSQRHPPFKIRTITAFVSLYNSDFEEDISSGSFGVETKIRRCADVLNVVQSHLTSDHSYHSSNDNNEYVVSYEVQTIRIATNPFGEWLLLSNNANNDDKFDRDLAYERLSCMDSILKDVGIEFCALGPAYGSNQISFCPRIVESSPRFSCSANIEACDYEAATAAASAVNAISVCDTKPFLKGGLGNFRFCTASACSAFIPFFPSAKSDSKCIVDQEIGFGIGLENGHLAMSGLGLAGRIQEIQSVFYDVVSKALVPVDDICQQIAPLCNAKYIGIDASLNPSLDDGGSVAEAIEQLKEVSIFGGVGTLAAAAAITTTLQRLPIKLTGYCGLMLPVLEDRRLAVLAAQSPSRIKISQLLSISSVCGVGIDTVPIEAGLSENELSSLILDVAGLAHRWNKSLSCRVFPCGEVGSATNFDSPYMCNSRVFSLE